MADRAALEALFREKGCEDYRWIDAASIVVAQWVRMKCRFGCEDYGRTAACPPHNPPVDECREFIGEYTSAVVFRFEKRLDDPEKRHVWTAELNATLLEIERGAFLAGSEKAFVMGTSSCHICDECPGTPETCLHPESARPSAEGLGVDVFSTVRACGYPIEVLTSRDQTMNRYAILLVE
jgi:predicted metal-binding protein